MTLYQCLACKRTVLRFDDQIPRSCRSCGSGPAWMKAVKGDGVVVNDGTSLDVDAKTASGGSQ